MSINALILKTLWTVKWTVLYSSVAVSGRTKTIVEYSRKNTHSMSCKGAITVEPHITDPPRSGQKIMTDWKYCSANALQPPRSGQVDASELRTMDIYHTPYNRQHLRKQTAKPHPHQRAVGQSACARPSTSNLCISHQRESAT